MGRTSRWAAPPPILSLFPAQAPEKRTILGGTPVVPIPIPAPHQPRVRDAERDRVEDTVRNTEGLKPKNKARHRDRETEMERDRDTDNPKRQIGRDTSQRSLAAISDPPPQNQVGEERRPRNRGTLRRPSRAGNQRAGNQRAGKQRAGEVWERESSGKTVVSHEMGLRERTVE